VHHDPSGLTSGAARPFPAIADHVLLPFAGSVLEADERLVESLSPEVLHGVADAVPDAWLGPGESREAYVAYLTERLALPRAFAEEAERVRAGD
jgi:hypothetical protein